jgi:hypothetical protein
VVLWYERYEEGRRGGFDKEKKLMADGWYSQRSWAEEAVLIHHGDLPRHANGNFAYRETLP